MVTMPTVTAVHENMHQRAGEEQEKGSAPTTCARCSVNKKYAATAPIAT